MEFLEKQPPHCYKLRALEVLSMLQQQTNGKVLSSPPLVDVAYILNED